MLDITRQTANFVAGFNPADLPERSKEAARTGIIDCVGVMIAGAALIYAALLALSGVVTPADAIRAVRRSRAGDLRA